MSDFFQLVGGIGLLAGGLGYAWKAFKGGGNDFSQSAIANLQATVAGLEKENALQREENERLRSELKEQITLQSKMQGEMKVLQALAQGSPAIDGFAKRFDEVIKEFKEDIKMFKTGQDRIIDLLIKSK